MLNIERNPKLLDADDVTPPEIRELTVRELSEVAGGDYKIEFEVPPVRVVVSGGDNWGGVCVAIGTNFGCITSYGGILYWSGGPISGPVRGGPITNPPR